MSDPEFPDQAAAEAEVARLRAELAERDARIVAVEAEQDRLRDVLGTYDEVQLRARNVLATAVTIGGDVRRRADTKALIGVALAILDTKMPAWREEKL